jgi:LPXTG-motif cell wall-anchored protein
MSFDNCTEAYQAGRSNIPAGDPDYAAKLDRDNDGVACDNPPADFKPAPQTGTGTETGTETGAGTGTQLPQTGPAAELGVTGGALLAVGVIAALIVRRRRTRFTA